jgi:acyl-CoA reductase-like NAD-dependent aldehyde dehydrogenase
MIARLFINGQWIESGRKVDKRYSPYSGEEIGEQLLATPEDVEQAVAAAYESKSKVADIPVHERATILKRAASLLESEKYAFALLISQELGKPLKNTLDEVSRSVETLELSGEEAKRMFGETLPGGASKRGEHTVALTFKVPVGVIGAITPFNAPLNLICHKIGPAFAAGNSIVLKPAPQTPLIAAKLIDLLLRAGMPDYCVNMVLGGADVGSQIVGDSRVNVISFTGSARAGHMICREAGMKKVLLELGGNAATIVHADANLIRAAQLCVKTGFSNSGQSCISVQRIYVHHSVVEPFTSLLLEEAGKVKMGDPMDENTDIGCLVDENAAKRVETWIQESTASGGKILCGGKRRGAAVEPTVIFEPAVNEKVVCEEIFGPIVVILKYENIDDAIREANNSEFGLQAGIFTNNIEIAYSAASKLEVGGVVINGTSNFRLDHWPYGGVKQSGIGREGPRYAIEDMTETKMIVFQSPIL